MKTLPPNRRLFSAMCVLSALLMLSGSVYAGGSFENTLKQYAGESVKGYIQPLQDMFGANLNSGFYHSAQIPTTGFHFGLEIIGMASIVGDAQKTYFASAPPGFTPGTFETATVFGGKGGTATDQGTGFTFKGSDGIIDLSMLPLAAPQISIGDLFGTRALVRFITTPEFSDGAFPKITLWGLGVQHSVSQYLPDVPVDLSAHFFYNKFTVGDLIDVTGLSFGAQASKSISVLTVYSGLAWEKSKMTLSYKPSDGSAPVELPIDGANNFRFTVGLGLHLGFLSLFGDANFGSVTVLSAGIGFGS